MRRKSFKKASKKVQMWVFPDFRDLLKKKAIDKGTDVLSLTRKLALDDDEEIFEPITKTFKRIL